MVTTALAGNAGAALYGSLVGVDYAHALKIYYSKVRDKRCRVCKGWVWGTAAVLS